MCFFNKLNKLGKFIAFWKCTTNPSSFCLDRPKLGYRPMDLHGQAGASQRKLKHLITPGIKMFFHFAIHFTTSEKKNTTSNHHSTSRQKLRPRRSRTPESHLEGISCEIKCADGGSVESLAFKGEVRGNNAQIKSFLSNLIESYVRMHIFLGIFFENDLQNVTEHVQQPSCFEKYID